MKFDGTLSSAAAAGKLTGCVWSWYPFKKNCDILIAGSGYENDLEMLKRKAGTLTEYSNISVGSEMNYDYIILSDYGRSIFKTKSDYSDIAGSLKTRLKPGGKFLMAVNNRLGVKYLCGEPDKTTGIPFDNISENNGAYRFSRNELQNFLRDAGFEKIKFYYPMPDCYTPQVVYTDEYRPSSELNERLRIYITNKSGRVMNETKLSQYLAENDELTYHANSFIAECGSDVSDVLYCALSPERSAENAFVTRIHENKVEKIPMYAEGERSLDRLRGNVAELSSRGVPVLDVEIDSGKAVMRKVNAVSLSKYLCTLDKKGLIDCLEKLYNYILMSSEYADPCENQMLKHDKNADWGPILKTAYIEMIPVNCFYENNDFLFFDQEYTMRNVPAKFVLFRTLRDICDFTPETEKIFPLSEMKKHFQIKDLWNYFQKEEHSFQTKLCRRDSVCRNFFNWTSNDENAIKNNRKVLQMYNTGEKTDPSCSMFNATGGLDGEKIILFGAGRMADHYLKKYGGEYSPAFFIDNDPDKWGTLKCGLMICPPDELKKLDHDSYRVVIALAQYMDIAEQLEELGVSPENYRVYNRRIDELLPAAITDTVTAGKYNVGYVTGAFDLFHIGHLNLLKRCKERCHYLIAGVLTDDIIRNEKKKEPFITFDERMEIVKQCRYVDRVIPIDDHNTDKFKAWLELRYGCLFSGSDHESEQYWQWLKKLLRSLGSELEFFPYTNSTSSTMLQKIIKEKISD